MPSVARSFAKLLGRQPSEREVKDLLRIRDALGLKDNDALWLVLIALESYDTLFRRYPEMVSTHVRQSIDDQRAAIAAIADAETRRALGTLSDAVARTSETVSSRLLEAARLQALALAMMMMLAYGSFCMFIGYLLASGRIPFWRDESATAGLPMLVLSTLARAPAGGIAALAGASLALLGVWHARSEIRTHRRYGLVWSCLALTFLAVACTWPML